MGGRGQWRGRASSRLKVLASGVAFGVMALAAGQAGAQGAAPDDAVQEVIVTGSRIARNGFTAPTPVTVLGQERLQQRGATNVADALNELPSFRPLVTPLTQQAVGGNIGARVLDLRGLGATRTLVLLDGKRFIPSTTVGTIDANLIPSALIGRTEVVTGGASAAYGSDAVAGVVNFILDKSFTGLRASAQFGRSQRGDADNYNFTAAYGTAFAEGKGHAIFSVEYDKSTKIGDCYSRDWCPNEQVVSNSPAGSGGLPANLRVGPDAPGNLNQDGLINTTSGPLRGITFNPDGSIRRYQYGQIFGTNLSPVFTLGGEGTYENGYLQGIMLLPPVERITGYSHFDYEFSPRLKAGLDLSYGQVKGTVIGSLARNAAFNIARNNAFLPAAVAQIMDANNISSFTLGRVFGDLGGAVDHSNNKTYRAVLSFEGQINDSWAWDAYYQYGKNKFEQNYTGNVVSSRLTNAVAAVNTAGGVVCAINADAVTTNDDPNCAPFNLFGRGRASAAAKAYVAPSGFQTADTREDVLAANLHGDLFQLPGGTFAIAAGGEYRSDRIAGTADPLSSTNQFWSFNGKAINGKIKVTEGYIEGVAPLLRDAPIAKSLELNGAVRRTHYERSSPGRTSSSTNVTTWKVGLVYEPIEQLRLRATRSRDIRAPNISELFGPVTSGRVTILDPQQAGAQIQIDSLSGSNAALNPETADTFTVGAVVSPRFGFLPSFKLSVDYYSVEIQGAISTLGAQVVINRCAQGATEFCPFVTRNAGGTLTLVQDVLQNVNRQKNRGVDIEASWRNTIGRYGALDFRVLATRYLELSTRDSVGITDRVGQTGYRPGTTTGVPNWILDGYVSWTLDKATVGLHSRYIAKGIFDTTLFGPEDAGYVITAASSISSNRVESRLYFDLNASYRLNDRLELFGVVNNLFDRDPPLAASAQGGTNQVYFDPIGRYFKVGARLRM
jgi:outer membrane receptor protein involved in Fe transport